MYPSYVYYTSGAYSWRITVQRNFVIRITFVSCVLKRDSAIRIYDGFDSASETLSRIHSANIPTESILSTTNVVFIEFEIATLSESMFKLLWSEVARSDAELEKNETYTLNCTVNSVMTVNDGENYNLQSPGYPDGYGDNLKCVWTFLPGKAGYHVDIFFSVIDLEATPNCAADFIQIGKGNDLQNIEYDDSMCQMSQIVQGGRYHGEPKLRVKFKSDYSNNRTGFSSIVTLDCGGLMEGTHGVISHDMTTSNHTGMNDTCNWRIIVNRGRTIQFEFDKLNIAKNDDGSCNSYIIIRNGIHEDSPFLGAGKYCSEISRIPATSGNKAIVQFVRNRVFQKTNEFVLKYHQIEHECGGTYTLDYSRDSIIINSPNYPNIPTPHIECVWRVTAPNGELLRMEFLDRFDLESMPPCESEYVEIREGTTSTAPTIGKYCRERPQPIYSSSNMIRITYFTDIPVPKNGFKAKITFARCGKSFIVVNSGFVTSPGFPARGKIFESLL